MGSGYKPEPAEDMLAPKLLFGSVNRREKEFLFKIVFPNKNIGTLPILFHQIKQEIWEVSLYLPIFTIFIFLELHITVYLFYIV